MTDLLTPEPLFKAPPKKPVGFQFDVKQWLGDNKLMAMSFSEKGMHLKLMCLAWQESPPCTLPDSDEQIAQWLGLATLSWTNVHKPKVMSAWKQIPPDEPHAGRWMLEGLQRSYHHQVKVLAARSMASQTRWEREREQALTPTGDDVEKIPKITQTPPTVWRVGAEFLGPQMEEAKARSLIGKWIRVYGQEVVAKVLAEASVSSVALQAADRLSYVTGMFSKDKAKTAQRQAPGQGSNVF
jgi:hypothetical protein